jgi:hypothetical protein
MDELLHALRLKGRATVEELAGALADSPEEVQARLLRLESEGLAVQRASNRSEGWMLTPRGRDAHAVQARDIVSGQTRALLIDEYRQFLDVNERTKRACAIWQTTTDEQRRSELLADLEEVQTAVMPALERSGEVVPRFGRYATRLRTALDRAHSDPRYVVSPVLDSFHTIWFECHEDFRVTLGRSRHEEASW